MGNSFIIKEEIKLLFYFDCLSLIVYIRWFHIRTEKGCLSKTHTTNVLRTSLYNDPPTYYNDTYLSLSSQVNWTGLSSVLNAELEGDG